ncbi:MAG: hypothetical protein P4L36_02110 [Holophaga sp.]|nr:hypothetical protein [Holophaga sp.]
MRPLSFSLPRLCAFPLSRIPLIPLAGAVLAGLPCLAMITYQMETSVVPSATVRTFTIAPLDRMPRAWTCTLQPGDMALGAKVRKLSDTEFEFTAPLSFTPLTCTVTVHGQPLPEGPKAAALKDKLKFAVAADAQGGGLRGLMEATFPGAFTPQLRPLLSPRKGLSDARVEPGFRGASQLAFLADPAWGTLHRHWLCLHSGGFQVVSLQGAMAPPDWLAAASGVGQPLSAFALRPQACIAPGAPWLLFATQGTDEPTGWTREYRRDSRLFGLNPDGAVVPLTAPEIRFNCVQALAMTLEGDVFVLDKNQNACDLYRIDALGTRTQVAGWGLFTSRDTHHRVALLDSMAMDLATGDLYLASPKRILRLSRSGGLSQVWEDPEAKAPGFLDPSRPLDWHGPRRLTLHGRRLLFGWDPDRSLRMLDLNSGERNVVLRTLAPLPLEVPGTCRPGRVPNLSGESKLGPEASLAWLGNEWHWPPPALATAPEGMTALGMGGDLYDLELPLDPVALPSRRLSTSEVRNLFRLDQGQPPEVLFCDLGLGGDDGRVEARLERARLAAFADPALVGMDATPPPAGVLVHGRACEVLRTGTPADLHLAMRIPEGDALGFGLSWNAAGTQVRITRHTALGPATLHATWDRDEDGAALTLTRVKEILEPLARSGGVPFLLAVKE